MESKRSETESSWLGTRDAARKIGVTLRSLYRLIDQGHLIAYKFGKVIRLKQGDVEAFISASRIEPGSLRHLLGVKDDQDVEEMDVTD